MAFNSNQWTAYGVVLYEPRLMKMSGDHVACRTVIATQSAKEKVYLPITAYNKKAHTLIALAHKGSTIFVKGSFRTKTTTTSIKAKELLHLELKVNEFEVLLREPVKIEETDFADAVAVYDPETFMEVEEDVE